MKHEKHMDKTDKAELTIARRMIDEGRAIRKRIIQRVRTRAYRAKDRT